MSPDTSNDAAGLGRVRALIDAGIVTGPVVHDSRQVTPGALYACLRGEHFDGHDFVDDAIAAGAAALFVDHLVDGVDARVQVVVDDTRTRLGPIASLVAGDPSERLTTIGITGTNGKTTTAQLVASILETAGHPTGVVGTLHGPRTTPEAPELQRLLQRFIENGSRAAVLEVSSHALSLHRVDGTRFDAVGFTNLGHDHLDLHGSREEYFRAKASLFDPAFAPVGVVNVDDTHGRLIADAAAGPDFEVVPYSLTDVSDVEVSASAHRYVWRGHVVEVPLGGRFNVSNSLAALTIADVVGIDHATAVAGIAATTPVPGRFEVIDSPSARARGITVVVDYAHTPDGLDVLLESARDVAGSGAVIVVFGCGGDRDRDKRPVMGAVASRGADQVIVTSDNPRRESPQAIIAAIVAGMDPAALERTTTIADRAEAIGSAIDQARAGDVVVIAGKGHERTQEIGDQMIDFDDRAVARARLEDAT